MDVQTNIGDVNVTDLSVSVQTNNSDVNVTDLSVNVQTKDGDVNVVDLSVDVHTNNCDVMLLICQSMSRLMMVILMFTDFSLYILMMERLIIQTCHLMYRLMKVM